jgi:uncharacterized protein YdeI (YjbR/CyaY-like superfamily)
MKFAMKRDAKPTFFTSGAEFGAWLDAHGTRASELLLGFYNAKSAKKGLTYKQALDEALCSGWIDGLRKNFDAHSYTIRFTPRKAKSNWSAINIARVEELKKLGMMKAPGLAAYEQREEKKSRIYSYENQPKALDAASQKLFKANAKAWTFYMAQRPSYQRLTAFWVVDAVKEETRAKRLRTLIDDSEHSRWIKGFISPKPKMPAAEATEPKPKNSARQR